MDLIEIKVETLEDYMVLISEIYGGKPWTGTSSFLLHAFITDFEKNNPELFQKFKFEHELAYQKPLLTSTGLISFDDK